MATLRRWHRWLGLCVGLPCLLWGTSGTILAWKHMTSLQPPGDPARVAGQRTPFVVPVEQALRAVNRKDLPQAVEWRWLLGRPRYELRYAAAPERVSVDGLLGQVLPKVDEALARRVAEADGPPGPHAVSVTLQDRYSLVYRPGRELPALRVRLDNGDDVYVSPASGQVLVHADDLYRFLRFVLFGLHMWDLSNAPEPHRSFYLLGACALGVLGLGISGLWLFVSSWPRRRRPVTGTARTPPPTSP